ncbi:MAG: hypothetical protein ACRDJ9_28350, partial [Dehalococcoidia bacterium]
LGDTFGEITGPKVVTKSGYLINFGLRRSTPARTTRRSGRASPSRITLRRGGSRLHPEST